MIRSMLFGQPQGVQPNSGDLSPMGLLQAYRSNPFDLSAFQTPQARTPQLFLPPALPNIDYSALYRAQQPAKPSPYGNGSIGDAIYNVASSASDGDGSGAGGGGGGGK